MSRLQVESPRGSQELAVAEVECSLRLSDLLRRKHLPLNTRCGQRGLCDGCVIELVAGELIPVGPAPSTSAVEGGAPAKPHQTEPLSIRACEHRLPATGAVVIRIPPRSLLTYEPQVVSEFKVNIPHAHDPLWQQVPVRDGNQLDADQVAARLQRHRPVRFAPDLPPSLLGPGFPTPPLHLTLEYRADHWLVTEAATEPVAEPLGIAIDVGTTTVALLLVNLANGEIVARAAHFNRQMHLGDDVLTRINLCSIDPAQVGHLRDLLVRDTLQVLIDEVLQKAGAAPEQVRCVTAAGNTTMLHLLAGVDPSPMGVAPFTPRFIDHTILDRDDSRLHPAIRPTTHLLPGAAAYVGADLTAGALATGLMYDDGPNLLVDVGTNGEIILKYKQHLYGCATAAGPAFEGAGLTNGVRAADGAISHLELADHPLTVTTERIGGDRVKPIGLCGTAYIDFLAQARAIGLLTPTGRLAPAAVDDAAGHVIEREEYGKAFRVARGAGQTDILITEPDIASLLQAKGAIAAGILTLLEKLGLRQQDVKTVYLAGGFGLHLRRDHAVACGLLPGFAPDQVEVVGNTSLAGAYLALMDCGALDEIVKCGRQLEVIELNLDPGFEDRYIDQLALP